jgi:hypothetical protein
MNLRPLFDLTVPLPEAINGLLRPLIGPFKATTSAVVGNNEQTTEVYATIVHNDGDERPAVPIDNVAAAIEFSDVLTVETLAAAYQRIRILKSLRKTDQAAGEIHMTTELSWPEAPS